MKTILSLILCIITTTVLAETETPQHDIDIIKFKFEPAEITIDVGESIRWTNKEKRQYHSVWFEKTGEPEPDYFFPDEFYERTFDAAGDFPYRCGPHPKMIGMVHVVQSTEDSKVEPDTSTEESSTKDSPQKEEPPKKEESIQPTP